MGCLQRGRPATVQNADPGSRLTPASWHVACESRNGSWIAGFEHHVELAGRIYAAEATC